jgi:tRNA-splicing ligase RtcB
MKEVITDNLKIPIKLWLSDIEAGALAQCHNLAMLPFAFKHVAIMPDSHEGYGMPIGGVLATKDVIIPNAVGVDIGCGMCAVKTDIAEISKSDLLNIVSEIRAIIPVGFNHCVEKQDERLMPFTRDEAVETNVIYGQYESALHQIGTLGGGNHFIEIQKGSDGFIWIMIHSGSRNLGKRVADYYNKLAVNLNELWFSEVSKDKELAFLPIRTNEAKQYLKEMNMCVKFAFANRSLMMNKIESIFFKFFGCAFDEMINVAHNYARYENHFNQNVIIHRKGATSAKLGETGIIPGSQGTKSYIVKGLGNPQSFESCSHGAGRKMGRKQARRELNLEEEKRKLDEQGIIHAVRNVSDLDEAPGSYKDIDVVMENQKDLVEILVELKPLAVIKG